MSDDHAVIRLREGGDYKPEIRVESIDGMRMLVKDYRSCGAWFRRLFARWLVTREFEAYCAARGLPGVASVVRRPGPYVLAIEYVEAEPCTELDELELPEDFWQQLTHIVGSLHARRIAHGDLKTLENILVTREGEVRLVDFSSAAYSWVDPIHLVGYPTLRRDDRRAIVKAKLLLAPERVTGEDLAVWEHRLAIERLFRRLRERVRPLIKALGGTPLGGPRPKPNKRRVQLHRWRPRSERAEERELEQVGKG